MQIESKTKKNETMKNLKTRLSLIRSFIARTPKGKTWLSQQYEPYSEEIKRTNRNNIIQ